MIELELGLLVGGSVVGWGRGNRRMTLERENWLS